MTPAPPASRQTRWIPLLIALVTLVAVGRLCSMDFTWWDDQKTIHHNPLLNPPSIRGVLHYWTHAHMSLYVPVTYTVWSALAAIARVEPDDLNIALNPWVFHTANVLLHATNALLVYVILKRLVKSPWPAAAGAMIFGAHPVQVEAVGWVSGMKDLLCGFFVLLAVWQYLLFTEGGKRARVHYWAGMGLMVLGMLSKPTAVVTPWLVGALDLLVVGRPWRQVARLAGGWLALSAPCLIWAKLVQPAIAYAPTWTRPLIAGDAVAFYLWKLIWPATLIVDYGRHPQAVISRPGWWLTSAVPLVIAIAAWMVRKNRPMLLAAFVLFVGGMAPVLGLSPFQFQSRSTTADHYLYLPMLGVALAVAYVVSLRPRKSTAYAFGLVIAILAIRSAVQAGVWANDLSLFSHELAFNPESAAGHDHMGIYFQDRAQTDRANAPMLFAQSEQHWLKALQIDPESFISNMNLGLVRIWQGKTHEAIGPLMHAAQIARDRPQDDLEAVGRTHYALGAVLWREGRQVEAIWHFEEALEYTPDSKQYAADLARARQALSRQATTRPATTPTTRPQGNIQK